MKNTLLALLPLAALSFAAPVHAQYNQLQWRTTTCQVEQDGRVIATGKCQAGFAYDTAVRAIKYWDAPTNRWTYDEVGQAGVSFGSARECLVTRYTDGTEQATCTVPTPEQLGIYGD
jgi:hypothetical protein